MRELTKTETAFCSEQGLDPDLFAGEQIDESGPMRRDGYRIIERASSAGADPAMGAIQALQIKPGMTFGNMMEALGNAFWMAEVLGLNRIYLPPTSYLRKSFKIRQVKFVQEESPTENTLFGQFFYRATFSRQLSGKDNPDFWKLARRAINFETGKGFRLLRGILRYVLSRIPFPTSTVAIHLRSGDVFESDKPHPGYWQPPLVFYTSLIEKKNPRLVVLIFESRANPVVDALIDYLASRRVRHKIVDGPLQDAFVAVLRATHFVGARGTFSIPMLAMSSNLREVNFFEWPRYRKLFVVDASVTFAEHTSGAYRTSMMPWTNSPTQRQEMLAFQGAIQSEQFTRWR